MYYNKNNRLESQSSKNRYLHGKDIERSIIECLKKHGFIIKDADGRTDREDKIDFFLVEDDRNKPCQVKCRMGYSGKQFLLDIFEPFFGLDSSDTKPGRDYIGKYEVYIVLIDSKIYIVDGIRQKKIVENVLKEWSVAHNKLPVFDSSQYEGVQIRYTTDRNNRR